MKEKAKKLVDAVTFNQFGTCPICKKPMMLLKSDYKAFTLSSSGWITSMADQTVDWEVVCPNCHHHHTMKITKRGLTPIELADDDDDRLPILEDNPIGEVFIEEK